ncbi:AAA family ATPase [Tuwongella immobilis]|uniref:AAA+ ATPase domain-containing protein n=1 Tax=Tuwongella immobilis TaxID=692036 RepID=A0A6C2YHJ0_9BACT|nr:AAA family ATPase [Tuwongella immobilis]VIP00603.1 family protein : Uncharacterized protein OS=Phaeodactylibacter xiamenensis GN=IX84_23845 PE=4 SV=1: AAA_2: ClpB_D2-small [Tuwongella immobilis]VTR96624.1 family protein : Uncharacterized protein OS=Phaeodactylibacter xiamenensis GN=IX84_23845 PE=4 SV=1: AAA_2: ClpB_D2-small [Tuwongella immobilis]
MAHVRFPLHLFWVRLHSGWLRAEALLFPEMDVVGANVDRTHERLRRKLRKLIQETPVETWYARRVIRTARAGRITVTLTPPAGQEAWTEPWRIRVPIALWKHDDETTVVRIPSVQASLIFVGKRPSRRMIARAVLDGLVRCRWRDRLREIAFLPLHAAPEIATVHCHVPTPIELRRREREAEKEPKKLVLPTVTTLWERDSLQPAFGVDDTVKHLAELLQMQPGRSIVLVGVSGVGKSSVIREFARQRHRFQLGQLPMRQTSGARLVAGMTGFGEWQERVTQVWKEAAQEKAILVLGNLIELMEVGKSEHQRAGIGGFLQPSFARNEVATFTECTPEEWAMVERLFPALAAVLTPVEVAEPTPDQCVEILAAVAESQSGVRIVSRPLLQRIDLLHRRYATYSAFPGRTIRFLDLLPRRNEATNEPACITAEQIEAAFSRLTGLPRVLLHDSEPLNLPATREWFTQRVMGQPQAVDWIVGLLGVIKARLTPSGRPLASLLFVGPTGVGKTELAKALATFLFGSPDRLTRFDMSEYNSPLAVQRLIGLGDREGQLTARIREQPFSVVLLDEFEKADPSLDDLLLQMLGEARLTDHRGRLADFRNSVIILTSNLGAESFQQGGYGFSGQATISAQEHFEAVVQSHLRPELVNRMTRIIPFLPLDQSVIRDIARREWQLAGQREGFKQHRVTLPESEPILDHLAQVGFDVRYGARPLKRALEREYLVPLADAINSLSERKSLRLQLDESGPIPRFQVEAIPDEPEIPKSAQEQTALQQWELSQATRMQLLRFLQADSVRNRFFQWNRLQAHRAIRRYEQFGTMPPGAILSEYSRLREWAESCQTLRRAVEQWEFQLAELLWEPNPVVSESQVHHGQSLRNQLQQLQMEMASQLKPDADVVTIGIFPDHLAWGESLLAALQADAQQGGYQTKCWNFLRQEIKGGQPRRINGVPVPAKWEWVQPPDRIGEIYRDQTTGRTQWRRISTRTELPPALKALEPIGYALEIRGPLALLRYESTPGFIEFVDHGKPQLPHLALIVAQRGTFASLVPPDVILKRFDRIDAPKLFRIHLPEDSATWGGRHYRLSIRGVTWQEILTQRFNSRFERALDEVIQS